MAPQPDPHTELGLLPTADQAEIRHAYRRRLLEHHPDTREQHDETAAQSDLALQRTLEAYDTLRGHRSGTTPEASPTTPRRSTRGEGPPAASPGRAGQVQLRVTPVRWAPPDKSPLRDSTARSLAIPDPPTPISLLRWLLRG